VYVVCLLCGPQHEVLHCILLSCMVSFEHSSYIYIYKCNLRLSRRLNFGILTISVFVWFWTIVFWLRLWLYTLIMSVSLHLVFITSMLDITSLSLSLLLLRFILCEWCLNLIGLEQLFKVFFVDVWFLPGLFAVALCTFMHYVVLSLAAELCHVQLLMFTYLIWSSLISDQSKQSARTFI